MPKILLISVGGSPQPIITSIQALQPDRVVFFCTTGEYGSESQVLGKGLPCKIIEKCEVKEELPNLPTHLGLGDRFQAERDVVKLDNPDDPPGFYLAASKKIQELLQEYSRHDIIVDYTGGTKSMALALGMAGIDNELSLFVTTAARRNIRSVVNGELPERVSISSIAAERRFRRSLPEFLAQYNYSAVVSQLAVLLTSELPPELREHIRDYVDLCRAFDAWDRFEHHTALEALERFKNYTKLKPVSNFLKRVMHSRSQVDEHFEWKELKGFQTHGYEVVEDLLLNAERREIQGRYDEAVARLYRALELLMQIRFQQHYDINTRGVLAEKLKTLLAKEAVSVHEKMLSVTDEPLIFGSKKGYELLRDFSPVDPLGQLYKQKERKVREAIAIRNHSLFAHGLQPSGKKDYRSVKKVIVPFIDAAIEMLRPKEIPSIRVQFPDVAKIIVD